jgi:catechol 2,3-dioxygenase-like lactoylglutathione lyase family enzyme
MKRFHVHVGVADLDQSVRFYSRLFGVLPSVRKPDYAKWTSDDPSLNFAISARGDQFGINHLGLQVDSDAELAELRGRFANANAAELLDQPAANCCYAKSNKHWVTDPQGIAWEAFHTLDSIRHFAADTLSDAAQVSGSCCSTNQEPAPAQPDACCAPTTVEIKLRGRSTA